MVRKEVKVVHPSGLQVNVAGAFCDLAMEFESKIHFHYRGRNEANAKSVLSILGAGIRNGEIIELVCEGADEREACDALAALLSGEQEG